MSRVAVFDIGTVSCRLGIFDLEDSRITNTVLKDLEICNLGEGVDSTNIMQEHAIHRVMKCMKHFVDEVQNNNVDTCICSLTSAARDAENSSILLKRLSDLGIIPQVIPGDLEAKLSFLGVAQDFPNEKIAVMDSGGGSTELCLGMLSNSNKLTIDWLHSYNIGARRLTERFGLEDAQDEIRREEAICSAREIIREDLPFDNFASIKLIGVGGTATTLAAIEQKLKVYNPALVHLSQLTLDRIDAIAWKLNCLSLNDREKIDGLQPQRAEIIVGGICCIEALMQEIHAQKLIISESDILCGLAIIADSSFKYEENVLEWNVQLFNI